MFDTQVVKFQMSGPEDVSGLVEAVTGGRIQAADIQAIIAKTEGNGRVNDYSRPYALHSFEDYMMETLGLTRGEVQGMCAMVMSGGCEGIMSPHAVAFSKTDVGDAESPGEKRLLMGVAFTRELLPEELGTMAQVDLVAEAAEEALAKSGVDSLDDVGYVQVKCPLLTSDRINDAASRGKKVVSTDTTRSMSLSNGCSALGAAVGLGEIDRASFEIADVCSRGDLYSEMISCSAGVELMRSEVVVLGNSAQSVSRYKIGRAVMQHLIDADAVRQALKNAGLVFDGLPGDEDLNRVVHVLAKAGAPWDGRLLDKRVTLLTDSVLGTRPRARRGERRHRLRRAGPGGLRLGRPRVPPGSRGGRSGSRHHRGVGAEAPPSRETSSS